QPQRSQTSGRSSARTQCGQAGTARLTPRGPSGDLDEPREARADAPEALVEVRRHGVPDVGSVAPADDDPRLAQDAQVMADGRLTDGAALGEVARTDR